MGVNESLVRSKQAGSSGGGGNGGNINAEPGDDQLVEELNAHWLEAEPPFAEFELRGVFEEMDAYWSEAERKIAEIQRQIAELPPPRKKRRATGAASAAHAVAPGGALKPLDANGIRFSRACDSDSYSVAADSDSDSDSSSRGGALERSSLPYCQLTRKAPASARAGAEAL